MQLKRFAVKGFKNFQTEIVLENLSAIAVIHGENNVGKSNLLEAMQLFFQLLLVQESLAKKIIGFSELEEQGFYPSNIFNLEKPVPIEINVTFTLQPEELELADIQPLLPSSEVQIAIQLKHLNRDC